MHPTVKNQSTSPHTPNDSEAYQLTTKTTGDQPTNAKADVSSDSFIFHLSILIKTALIGKMFSFFFSFRCSIHSKYITRIIQLLTRVKRHVSHKIRR